MSRRTGQNGTLEQRNGAWRGRFLVDVPGQMERQKRSVVLGFKKDMTKSEAKRKLKEIIRQEGIDLPTYVIPSTLSFAQKVELWERTYVAKRKPSTQGLIAYHLTYLLPKWGKSPVELITAEVVNEWVGGPEVAHLAPETIKGIVKTLQTALGKRFGRRAISYPSQDEVEDDPRCYLAEEVEKIVDAAKGQYKALFKLAAETGARAGELYALTVNDLLFNSNVVRVNKSMYNQKTGSPKTKNATRWINVKLYVMEMLKAHLNGRTEGLVFQSRRKTPLVNCVVLNKHLHRCSATSVWNVAVCTGSDTTESARWSWQEHRWLSLKNGSGMVARKWSIATLTFVLTLCRANLIECLIMFLNLARKLLSLTQLTLRRLLRHDVSLVFATIPGSSNR